MHTSHTTQVDKVELKRRFSPYVEQCVVLLKAPDVTPDLFVEVLGTLANLSVPEFDFQALAQRHDLVQFLAQFAAPGAVDDDILLEIVMFMGAKRCRCVQARGHWLRDAWIQVAWHLPVMSHVRSGSEAATKCRAHAAPEAP